MTKQYSKSAKSKSFGGGDGSVAQGANLETLKYQNQAALRSPHEDDAELFADIGNSVSNPGQRPRGLGANLVAGISKGLAYGSKTKATEERKGNYDKYENVMNYLQEVNTASVEQKQWHEQRESARREMMPQVLAYIENIDRLDPQSQRFMAQDMLSQYGEALGENYKLSSVDGSNPFLMTIQSDKGQQLFDMRTLFAGDEAMQQAISMKMPEYQMKLQEERQNKQREFQLKQDAIDVKKYKEGIPGGAYGSKTDHTSNPFNSVPTKTLKESGGGRAMMANNAATLKLAEDIPIITHEMDEAERIIKENPEIGTTWNNLVSTNAVSKAAGMSDKMRSAYERLSKISSRVAETYIKAKGSAITNEERKLIEAGLFDNTLLGSSSQYNIKSVRNEIAIAAKRADFIADELARGYVATPKSFDNFMKSQEQNNASIQENDPWDQLGTKIQ